MDKSEISEQIQGFLAHLRQDALTEAQTPAPETDPEYEIKNYPRLLQLAKAGLVPEDMVFKMANVLKDPKRFGVSRAIRDQLYDLMIKTLNYIVVSDPASFARFRAFLLNTEEKEYPTINDQFKAILEQARTPNKIPAKENEMDKIEKYKNLNEQVNKMLRDTEGVDPLSIQEEIHHTASQICEALQDPNRVTALMRSGLIDSGRVSRVRNALQDPEKAMKNSSVRSDLINMLMSLINIVTSNPSAYASVKKGAKNLSKEPQPVEEELVGGQKKLDVNKNGKVDAADLAALRAGKKTEDGEIEEEKKDGEEETPHQEPKGEKGKAAVERLGRDYKTGGFEKIAKKAAEKYGSKEAGERVAGAIYWKKVAARKGG